MGKHFLVQKKLSIEKQKKTNQPSYQKTLKNGKKYLKKHKKNSPYQKKSPPYYKKIFAYQKNPSLYQKHFSIPKRIPPYKKKISPYQKKSPHTRKSPCQKFTHKKVQVIKKILTGVVFQKFNKCWNANQSKEPKYIFFKELELDEQHGFTNDFGQNSNIEQLFFSPTKKAFMKNLKVDVKLETDKMIR